MAIEYTIAAHPTRYAGIQFRSRLEATWAAFFDLLGWRWEYEPFDLGKWSPDFLIKGNRDILVEVKPTSAPDLDVINKITKNANGYVLFYCGVSPAWQYVGHRISNACIASSCCARGKPSYRHDLDQFGSCWMNRAIYKVKGRYDMVVGHGNFHPCLITGEDADSIIDDIEYFVGDEIYALWSLAKNKTQWRPT